MLRPQDTETRQVNADTIRDLIARDKNHPSVVEIETLEDERAAT